MSPSILRATRLVLAVAVTLGLLAACGDDDAATEARSVAPLDATFLPETILGLAIEQEDVVEDVTSRRNAYLDQIGLYSLRSDDLLQATLQIGRFSDEADPTSSRFRRGIVANIGSTTPRAFRMGEQTVWLTTGQAQSMSVWFEDDLFFLLAVRDDFERSRSLLREIVELTK